MSKISLKSKEEIAIMAEGGEKLGSVLDSVLKNIKPGLTTLQIDEWIEEGIIKAGGKPSFKTVPNYYWSSCVGINSEVVHSIPKKNKLIKEGDLLKVDLGMVWQSFHTDLSWTVLVSSKAVKKQSPVPDGTGQSNRDKKYEGKLKFLEAGEKALEEAIKVAVVGNRIGHISQKIEETVRRAGFSPVEVLTGHGIGKKLHEEPLIPELVRGRIENTPLLVAGMTLAVEVIYNLGSAEVVLEDDGWTVSTKDGKISGLFERTIAITQSKPLVLTRESFVC